MDICVANSGGWNQLISRGLTTVVDPMVYRSADVFLRGAKAFQGDQKDKYSRGLAANVGSLVAFFDALVFNDALPMFNYNTTFPQDLEEGRTALERACNEALPADKKIIVPVSVEHEAYRQAKDGSASELRQIRAGASQGIRGEILQELSDLDYEWRPDLPAEEDVADGAADEKAERERELTFVRFLLGGLIFGSYARALGGEHVLQPKRSRLLLSAIMGKPGEYEDTLLLRLREAARDLKDQGLVFDIPARTSVLPYLLLQHENGLPRDLVSRALNLRDTGGARRYREMRREVGQLLNAGKQPLEAMRILADAQNEAKQLLLPRAARTGGLEFEATATFAGPELGVSSVNRLFGWFNDRMPWRRHFRLLQRLRGADYQFRDLTKQIMCAWNREPGPPPVQVPAGFPVH